ncbi:MAG: homocysteine S-methyltransferase family protein, partial [Clostridia bacterium]|nr:homocysteine S-methyltransferase family protein [Clostridia bacterium]
MSFIAFLKNNRVILDGGMGTLLQEAGLKPGEHPELWCLTHPEVITEIHRAYYEAGSNLVCTNTFGANCLKFDLPTLREIILAGVRCARIAAEGREDRFVALDMGPTGKLLAPTGNLPFEEAVEIFAKTVRLGVEAGVDAILIETMTDSYETKAALLAAKENSDLPILVTNAYGSDGKLMTGATPAAMVTMLEGMGVCALGANCSLGPKQLAGVAKELLERASVPVILKPNAGLPAVREGKTEYDVTPEEFALQLAELVGEGVRLAG